MKNPQGISQLSPFLIMQRANIHRRENPRHVREAARIYDVRMAQFVLKIEKLSNIMGLRGSQDVRSPAPSIMAPVTILSTVLYQGAPLLGLAKSEVTLPKQRQRGLVCFCDGGGGGLHEICGPSSCRWFIKVRESMRMPWLTCRIPCHSN